MCEKMAEGHDISGSDDEAVGEPDTELYQLKLDGSDWQYLQLNGERLIWRIDLESLKNFVKIVFGSKESGRRPAEIISNSKAAIISWL